MCRQLNDGVQSGDVFEIALPDDVTAEEYLAVKVESAYDKGWLAEPAPEGGWHVWKEYEDVPEGTPTRKDRFMWVDGGG